MRLPPETLDDICCFVDSHSDLISLATTSHAWEATIIPRHSEYRKIRISRILEAPSVWAHLRRRIDLARNIRSVELVEVRHVLSVPDRRPTTLLVEEVDVPEFADDTYVLESFCTVLRALQNLVDFTWERDYLPTDHPGYEAAVFLALTNCHSLKRLRLSGNFATQSEGTFAVRVIRDI